MELAEAFYRLFSGLDRAYGTYAIGDKNEKTGKVGGRAVTRKTAITVREWRAHLQGTTGLGIPPLKDDATVSFVAIDVDDYRMDVAQFNEKIQQLHLPIVAARSKSGGAHGYIFFIGRVLGRAARAKMREIAAALGYPKAEIFPKHEVLTWSIEVDGEERSWHETEEEARLALVNTPNGELTRAVGNWINVPYFGGEMSLRYAVGSDGVALSPEEFVRYAETLAITAEELDALEVEPEPEERGTPEDLGPDARYPGIPPCLAILAKNGVSDGARNNALFNFTIYAKRAWPEEWEKRAREINQDLMKPPVGEMEARTTIRSAGRKTFNYRCSQPPICDLCDRATCLTRAHGVAAGGGGDGGGGGGYVNGTPIEMGRMTKVLVDPPRYYMDVNGIRVEFTVTQLLKQPLFIERVAETTNKLLRPAKGGAYLKMIQEKIENAIQEEAPIDATRYGQLDRHLRTFCNQRAQARELDELLRQRPYTDPKTGRTYFVLSDFTTYLERERVRMVDAGELYVWLRDRGGLLAEALVLKGQDVTVWSIPAYTAQTEEFAVPRVESGAPF